MWELFYSPALDIILSLPVKQREAKCLILPYYVPVVLSCTLFIADQQNHVTALNHECPIENLAFAHGSRKELWRIVDEVRNKQIIPWRDRVRPQTGKSRWNTDNHLNFLLQEHEQGLLSVGQWQAVGRFVLMLGCKSKKKENMDVWISTDLLTDFLVSIILAPPV